MTNRVYCHGFTTFHAILLILYIIYCWYRGLPVHNCLFIIQVSRVGCFVHCIPASVLVRDLPWSIPPTLPPSLPCPNALPPSLPPLPSSLAPHCRSDEKYQSTIEDFFVSRLDITLAVEMFDGITIRGYVLQALQVLWLWLPLAILYFLTVLFYNTPYASLREKQFALRHSMSLATHFLSKIDASLPKPFRQNTVHRDSNFAVSKRLTFYEITKAMKWLACPYHPCLFC